MNNELISEMQRSSRGWRCAACFAQGRIEQNNLDGTPLSEAHRCPGCGETICARHPTLTEPGAHHGIRAHTRLIIQESPSPTAGD